MERIAEDRGLSRAELEDRIVPDCDLDERGGRVFDFGPRQFRFALGSEMKPMVRDEAGKLKDDLPKPGVKDDAAKATAAVEDWKRLKKQVREVAKVQAERLEQAMVTGRRWSPADFESLLVRHPLMIHLVRLVLWGGYDEAGKLVSTFRVTEERDYADVDEASYRLEGIAKVGIVHPLHLTDEQRSAWGEIFGDYEIIPPFPQLGRSVHRLEPGREKDKDLAKGEKITVPAVTLVGILERHGWNRGIPQDAGIFHEHTKPFEGADVTAVIQYPGIPVGYMVDWNDQDVEKCFFVPGIYSPTLYPEHKNALPLGAWTRGHQRGAGDARAPWPRRGSDAHGSIEECQADGTRRRLRPCRGDPAPGVRGALRRRARAPGPRRSRRTTAPGLVADAAIGADLRAGRRAEGDRPEVRRPPRVPGALHRRAGHQPRPDADRRAGHGQELPERAAGRRRQRRLDPDHPGQRGDHRGQHQVFVELRPAARRGAERGVAGPGAAAPRDAPRARSSASRRSRAARSRSRTCCCRSSATA